ncbi:integrin alpha-6b isoform X1 [Haplochromis burtoni]|uniref:Integrin, alpha 6b n=1 Tax=Haplochromis burtoni TaxID=8153 RepID=A0A3Q3C4R8_HAPBU|nr:integrin alpha-6b isoform X1 [Haplochromis burtoni]
MEGWITCGLWLIAFLSSCGLLSAFNLDTDNVQRKTGDPGSLFGFSLAMHRQLLPQEKRMLLVGAPRAKALSRQKSAVTGGLYNCDMSTTTSDCSRVIFDNDENKATEDKENQWMGVTVKSQGPGGQVVTCAHRYQRRANVGLELLESRDIIGRCYVLSQSLKTNSNENGEGGGWYFCDQRARGHEMFGSCQQGLSATFDKDYHYIIFGAPGAYNWKGIVRVEQKNDSFIEMGIFDDGPYEAGDENQKNPYLVPVPASSYLGFSLDSGKHLTKKGQLTVVAGAPRANHSGAVVLLKTGGEKSNILVEEFSLEGEGLASSFGYDLTVLDLNKDGWEDIVVGAPQYFEKDGEIGGAVYVYINNAGKWNKVTPTRIDGPLDSMFGLAVENLGDINLDRYDDFAVGAPYDDKGKGKVYIYYGSATGQISPKASQVLPGPSGVKLFGYSLAGNMDLDYNSYPDLAVGSLSDSVFVYKARPVIDIQKKITITPKEIDLLKNNCENNSKFCLTIKACFSYSANPVSYAPKLEVKYTLAADTENRKNNLKTRAAFINSSPGSSHESSGTITLDTKGVEQCIERQLALQENIRDKLRGIPIDVSVEIIGGRRKRRQSSGPGLQPVLDAKASQPTRSVVEFMKTGCGSDNVCQSNLKMEYNYGHWNDEKFIPLPKENGVPVLSLSNQKEIALEVSVSNAGGDDAYEASMIASFPSSLTYSATRLLNKVNCQANRNGSLVDCDLGNPFEKGEMTTFYIILGTAGISFNTSEVEVNLQLKTTSMQQLVPVKAKAKVATELQLSVSGQATPSQVYFTGDVKGETAIKTESDIGSAITHHFRIINLGRPLTDFGTATLIIDWPKETADGKWLLYLMKITTTGGDQIECTPKSEINPLKKEEVNTRKRREVSGTQGSDEGTILRLIENKKSKTLSCDDGAKCVKIRCPLRSLDSNAAISLHSRLWNSTFIEDYSKLHHVEVIVNAALHLDNVKNTVRMNANTQVRLTAFPERREARYGGVPWWIIVLSILFGLLLLALLAFLLWKCGFFKRAKYEDKVPSYNAVRIKREERAINPGNANWENLEKKPWMTTWHDNEHYS